MHDGMPYGRIQGQGQGHSREVDRQSPTGLILYSLFLLKVPLNTKQTIWVWSGSFLSEFHHCRMGSIVQLRWISCLCGIAVFSFILHILSFSRDSVVNGPNLYLMHLCYCTKISSFWTTTTCNKADIWKMAKIVEKLYRKQTSTVVKVRGLSPAPLRFEPPPLQ